MKQIVCNYSMSGLTSSNISPFGGMWGLASAEIQCHCPWPSAGAIRHVRIKLATAPGLGKTWTFVVRQAPAGTTTFADTAITFSIVDTAIQGEDLTHSITVAPGDLLTLQWTASVGITGSSFAALSFEFESSTTNESGYTHPPGALHTAGTRIGGLFWSDYSTSTQDVWTDSATHPVAAVENVLPCDGVITSMLFHVNQSPGGGTAGWESAIYLNGVKQDGTGATVDTRVTHQGSGLDSSASFSLPVVTGDAVYVEVTALNTPASFLLGQIAVTFVADTNGESIVGGVHLNSSITGSVRYMYANNQGLTSATETERLLVGNATSFTLAKLRADCVTAPGTGASRAFQIRKNQAATALEAVVSGTNTTGSDMTDTVRIDSADTFGMEITPTNTPADSYVKWSAVLTVVNTMIATYVAGLNATVTSPRTALFNLDGVTRTVHAEQSFAIGGNLMLIEQADAPSGRVRYARGRKTTAPGNCA
jgi:hypothetical protein